MANEYKDVVRVESTEAGLTGILRNGQLGFATDGEKRMTYKFADGTVRHWVSDEQAHEFDLYADNVYHLDEVTTKINFDTGVINLDVTGERVLRGDYQAGDTGASLSIDAEYLKINGTRITRETGSAGEMLYCGEDGIASWTGISAISSIAAEAVTYTNAGQPEITNVQQALDELFHTTLSVSLVIDTADVDKGSTVDVIDMHWTWNNSPTGLNITSIASQGGAIDVGYTAWQYTGLGLTSDQAFSMIMNDGYETGVANDTFRFKLYKYWGQSANASPTEAIIEAASSGGSTFSTDSSSSKAKSEFSQAGGGNYVYYAYPSAWGALSTVKVNGFGSTWNLTTVSVTNGVGNTENYNCYTSPYPISGTVTLQFA